jgi:hypothetical protein
MTSSDNRRPRSRSGQSGYLPRVFRMSRMIQANTRSEGAHASKAPTIIAVTVVMIAPRCAPRTRLTVPDPGGSSSVAGLSSLGDRRLRTFVEPPPIGLVALPLTFVRLAAPGRAKLLEVQAEADQPERALAIGIRATICHDVASALVRRIQRMNCSWPLARQRRPQ